MDVTFFQNSKSGGPGLIGEYAAQRGWQIRQIVRFEDAERHTAEPLTNDLVVFLGSPRSAFEMQEPWIAHQFELIRRLLRHGTPLLGVCFGAQLLARVIGGEVRTMEQAYRGWYVNDVTDHLAWDGPWVRWHKDRIFLPDRIEPMASSQGIVQGFQYENAIGVQFHPEATPEILESWIASANGDTPAAEMAEALTIMKRDFPTARARTFRLLDHVFSQLNLN